MKHKVKIFTSIDSGRLESDINKWIAEQDKACIIDVKYSESHCGNSGGAIYYNYSALIHYTEN